MKSLIKPDNTNTILLSDLVTHFGSFNDAMKQHLEELQEEDATINLQDDYFPFQYNSIDDLLDDWERVAALNINLFEDQDI